MAYSYIGSRRVRRAFEDRLEFKDCELAEKATTFIEGFAEEMDVSFDPDDVEVCVNEENTLMERSAGEMITLWTEVDKDRNHWRHHDGFIIILTEKKYEKYGWNLYRHIIAHELAHVEVNHTYNEEKYTDGDDEFNKTVRRFGGFVDGFESTAALKCGLLLSHHDNCPKVF